MTAPARLLPILALALAACGEPRATETRGAESSGPAPAASAAPANVALDGILLVASRAEGGDVMLEPIAILSSGKLQNPWDVENDTAFHARWFTTGARYAVRIGGVPVGEASVTEVMQPDHHCSERAARAAVAVTAPLSAEWQGLASDAFPPGPGRRLVQPLTPRQQNELASLADSIHASHRITSAARAQGESERLFAVAVPGAEGPVLVGTFNVTMALGENQQTYTQMLVAEPRGGVYRPAYVYHERDDGETGVHSLLDAADLDGDGVPELIARADYAGGWGFVVLERTADGWTEIYEGGGGGC